MNLWFHVLFGVLAVLFFIWRYKNTRKSYALCFAIWAASSFLIYVSSNRIYQVCLGVLELILCAVSLIALYRDKHKRAKSAPEEQDHKCEEK